MTKINTYTLRRAYFYFVMIITALCSFYMLINEDNQAKMGTQRGFLVRSISLLFWSVCAYWYIKDIFLSPISSRSNPYRNRTIRWYIAYICIVILSILITNTVGFKECLAHCVVFLIAGVGLLGAYDYARRYGEQTHVYVLFGIVQCAIVAAYHIIYAANNILGVRGHFATSYYALYLLPLFIAHPKKWVRYLAIAVTSIVIISSVKRGGIVALVFGLMTYILTKRHIEGKGIRKLLGTFVLLALIGGLLYLGIAQFGDNLLERLFDSKDTTGSGRTEIWKGIFIRLSEQDISAWFTGNGHLATMSGTVGSRRGYSAHNDFLEIVFDYGIMALFCYLGFFISLGRYILLSIRQKSPYAAPLAMMLVILFVLSMLSIIILYYSALLVAITIASLIGWNEYRQHEINT